MILNVTLTGTTEMVAAFQRYPQEIKDAVYRAVKRQTLDLQKHVMWDKLSGQVLDVKSGDLRASIQETVTQEGSVTKGSVWSAGDVKYAAIHEFGGTTPPHDIYPKNAQALHFMRGGKDVFAKVVHHPGSHMPERSFLRSGLEDRRQAIMDDLMAAPAEAARKLGLPVR